VWVSATTAGAMTTTRPTAPNHAVQVGFCIRSHATQGVIFVSVQNGYELGELHDVAITSPSTGQVLKYDTNKWVNGAAPASTLNDLTDVTLTSPTNTQVLQYNLATTQWVNATLSAITGSGAIGQVAFWNGSGTQTGDNGFFWDNTNKRLGIGTVSPSSEFQINSTRVTGFNPFFSIYAGKTAGNGSSIDFVRALSSQQTLFGFSTGTTSSPSDIRQTAPGANVLPLPVSVQDFRNLYLSLIF